MYFYSSVHIMWLNQIFRDVEYSLFKSSKNKLIRFIDALNLISKIK